LVGYALYSNWAVFERIIHSQTMVSHDEIRSLFRLPDTVFEKILAMDIEQGKLTVKDVPEILNILRRFTISAMSLGSKTPVSHEFDATIGNFLGFAPTNAGEGGENHERWDGFYGLRTVKKDSDLVGLKRSGVELGYEGEGGPQREQSTSLKATSLMADIFRLAKHHFGGQYAGGQNGLSARYIGSLDQIALKYVQGAKGGEGGALPGKKNTGPGYDCMIDGKAYRALLVSDEDEVLFQSNNDDKILSFKDLGIGQFDDFGKLKDISSLGTIDSITRRISVSETRGFESHGFTTNSPPIFTDNFSVEDVARTVQMLRTAGVSSIVNKLAGTHILKAAVAKLAVKGPPVPVIPLGQFPV
jgi:glutamate synthase domain-containing protein 2